MALIRFGRSGSRAVVAHRSLEVGSLQELKCNGVDVESEKLLNLIATDAAPASLRDLATTIFRMADSIEQNWDDAYVRSNYPMFSQAARIERNAIPLSLSATKEEYRAKLREETIGLDLLGVPAWNMLLELFKQFAGGAKVSTKSLQLISRCPETTALRIIDRLAQRGIVERCQSSTDKRVTFVSLTREGVVKVGSVLEKLGD